VRAALDRAIAKWEFPARSANPEEAWITATSHDLEDTKAEAIQSVTQLILHEIRPLVTDINNAARSALGESYAESVMAKRIERLREFLATIRRLNEASTAPESVEFVLVDLVVVEFNAGGFSASHVISSRIDSVSAVGDPGLVRMAVQNAIRNAVEASEHTSKPVIINCGVNSVEAWISVLDEGVGIPEAKERLFDPGVTKKSKDVHFGWGLTIARRALSSLGGKVDLFPRKTGGAACEIRWPAIISDEDVNENSAS
jgi:signal transduction histidine kinase